MRISHGLRGPLANIAADAAWAATVGFDVLTASEVAHDPFLPLALAAPAAGGLPLQTHIAVAFARSPMITAGLAHDLQVLSGGRFTLGLGTQTKPHVIRRFSMPWGDHPVAQMREYVGALRAIWRDWDDGEALAFKGEHYRHTLMTDTFRPAPSGFPAPAIHLAAVGPVMTRLAGEVCDGLVPHAFSTPEWFRQVTLPALDAGLERAGRDRSGFTVHCPGFIVVTPDSGPSPERLASIRQQVAFYGSTPAYGEVLRLHGWGALHESLHRLSVQDDPLRWKRMSDLIEDEVLAAFCVIGPLRQVCAELAARFGDDVNQVHLSLPAQASTEDLAADLAGARAILNGAC
jgi:probable F420-dependent oxidoreductase